MTESTDELNPTEIAARHGASFEPPLDRLLTLGSVEGHEEWMDYLEEFGLGPDHISGLIRMATSEELHEADTERATIWAPVHAWRALGQLRATEAVEPLLRLFDKLIEGEDEWGQEEIPKVLALIGGAAIRPIVAFLRSPGVTAQWKHLGVKSLEAIATANPEVKREALDHLVRELRGFRKNDTDYNAFIVNALLELKEVNATPLIESAFASGRVALGIVTWYEVEIGLGVTTTNPDLIMQRAETEEAVRKIVQRYLREGLLETNSEQKVSRKKRRKNKNRK